MRFMTTQSVSNISYQSALRTASQPSWVIRKLIRTDTSSRNETARSRLGKKCCSHNGRVESQQ